MAGGEPHPTWQRIVASLSGVKISSAEVLGDGRIEMELGNGKRLEIAAGGLKVQAEVRLGA